MPEVAIPKEYQARKKLIAVPEREYRQFRAFEQSRATNRELQEVLESEAEIRAGKFIVAKSAKEALKEARARGWIE